jgi:peptidoglycan hydrolase CwlO-like protein
MSEEIKKVKEEDLKKIQENQKQMAQVINQVGAIEAQKQDLLAQVPVIRKEMDELKAELEKEYGKVSINLVDGTYEEIPEETLKKVD